MSSSEGFTLANNLTTASASSGQCTVRGGKYSVLTSGTPGTSALQMYNGTSWIPVQTLTAGVGTVQLPPGQVQVQATAATGLTVTLATVPS